MVDGRDRPGRRHHERRLPASELRPVWHEWPLPPSCGLDLLESGVMHNWTREQKAAVLGLSFDGYKWALHNALRKLRAMETTEKDELGEYLGG